MNCEAPNLQPHFIQFIKELKNLTSEQGSKLSFAR